MSKIVTRRGLMAAVAVGATSPALLSAGPALAAPASFVDVPESSPFFREIEWAYRAKISTGWIQSGKRYYRPLANTNRDAMAAFFYRLAGSPQVDVSTDRRFSSMHFTDVKAGSQFYKEIYWLNESGIAKGWPDGTFRPLQPITRDAMAAFTYRFCHSPEFSAPKTSPFRDVSRSSQFYKEICWLAETGISTGWPDGTYRPLQNISREAMAAFMYRLTEKGYPDVAEKFWQGRQCGGIDFMTYRASNGWTRETARAHAEKSKCKSFRIW